MTFYQLLIAVAGVGILISRAVAVAAWKTTLHEAQRQHTDGLQTYLSCRVFLPNVHPADVFTQHR